MPAFFQYLTVQELTTAPLGISLSDLPVPGLTGPSGVSGAQRYEAATNLIQRATSMINDHCRQILAPTLDSESYLQDDQRCWIDREGYLSVRAANFPVISVQSFQYGYPAIGGTKWTLPTLTDLLIEGVRTNQVTYIGWFQRRGVPRIRAQMTYLNGYPNTLLSAATAVGVTSLPLTDLTGIVASQWLFIYDGGNSENVQVAASYSPSTGAGNVTLAAATLFTHTPVALGAAAPAQPYDIAVSSFPPSLKQAALLTCKYLVEKRGSTALAMQRTGGIRQIPGQRVGREEVDPLPPVVQGLLQPYVRII